MFCLEIHVQTAEIVSIKGDVQFPSSTNPKANRTTVQFFTPPRSLCGTELFYKMFFKPSQRRAAAGRGDWARGHRIHPSINILQLLSQKPSWALWQLRELLLTDHDTTTQHHNTTTTQQRHRRSTGLTS